MAFPNGIASGDLTQTSAVLWARSTEPGDVVFEYSTDEDFSTIEGSVTATVTDPNVPVKVTVDNLESGTEYYYRVTDAPGANATGEFNTPAELGEYEGVKFGYASCWRGELGPYPAIANTPESDLDFFLQLGDSIYADYASDAVLNPDGTRKELVETLDEYRAKHQETVGHFSEARASTSFYITTDDHEVIDDFAGGAPIGTDDRFTGDPNDLINDSERFETGMTALFDYNPIEDTRYDTPEDPRTDGERILYRNQNFGSDAAMFVLDNRSFRDTELTLDQLFPEEVDLLEKFLPLIPEFLENVLSAPGLGDSLSEILPIISDFITPELIEETIIPLVEQYAAPLFQEFYDQSYEPSRTMLSEIQFEDLKADLLEAEENGVTWKFVTTAEPIQNIGVPLAQDRFEGYAAERNELLEFIADNDIYNVVFLSGDIHGQLVNNLTYLESAPQYFGEDAEGIEAIAARQIPANNAIEVVSPSVGFHRPLGTFVFQPLFDSLNTLTFGILEAAENGVISAEIAFGIINIFDAAGQALFQDPEFTSLSPGFQRKFNSLPVAPDNDPTTVDKDQILTTLLDGLLTVSTWGGYDPIGLDNNLPQADGLVDYELIQGGWTNANTFGWVEVEVDPETQVATFTTYGVPSYDESRDVDPGFSDIPVPVPVDNFEPEIYTQFSITPEIDEVPVELPTNVFGSLDGDTFDSEVPDERQFVGDNQNLFAGSGEDTIDVSLATGGNRIDSGSGDDLIFAGTDNRILAGSGDNTIFLGNGDGGNVVTGGEGADQFWLLTDSEDIPSEAQTITDFTIGEDVIGFGATGLGFDDLSITADGSNAIISAGGNELAMLRGTEATDLSASDFAFVG